MLKIRKVSVLGREQPMLLGFGLHPRPGELIERRCFSASPECHRDHPGDGAVAEPAGGQIAKQPHDSLVLLGVPTIVETVTRPKPRRRFLLSYDFHRNARGLTDVSCCEVAADTGQHDRLSVRVLRGLPLSARVLNNDPEGNAPGDAETSNLIEVHIIQLLKEPCSLISIELQ